MHTTIGSLYRSLLRDPEVSPEVQARVFTYGTRRQDNDLLASLASHPALVADLDRALGEHKSAKVRAAWIARPYRTRDELVAALAKEIRVKVLSAAACRVDLTPELYEKLGDCEHLKVAESLVGNHAAPLAVRLKAARTWGRLCKLDKSTAEWHVPQIFGNTPELHNALASETDSTVVMQFVAGSDLEPEVQRRVLGRLLDVIETTAASAITYTTSSFLRNALTAVVRIGEHPDTVPALRREYARRISKLRLPSDCQQLQQAAVAAMTRPRRPGQSVNPINVARSTRDNEKQIELAKLAMRGNDRALATALLGNPQLCVEAVEQIAWMVASRNLPQVLQLHLHRRDVVVALLAANARQITDDLLEMTGEPAAMLRDVVRKIVTGSDRVRIPDTLIRSRHLTSAAVFEFPTAELVHEMLPLHVRAELVRALTVHFGNDERHWDVFEGLAETSEQPFRAVLEACHLLIGTTPPEIDDVTTGEPAEVAATSGNGTCVDAHAVETAQHADPDADEPAEPNVQRPHGDPRGQQHQGVIGQLSLLG